MTSAKKVLLSWFRHLKECSTLKVLHLYPVRCLKRSNLGNRDHSEGLADILEDHPSLNEVSVVVSSSPGFERTLQVLNRNSRIRTLSLFTGYFGNKEQTQEIFKNLESFLKNIRHIRKLTIWADTHKRKQQLESFKKGLRGNTTIQEIVSENSSYLGGCLLDYKGISAHGIGFTGLSLFEVLDVLSGNNSPMKVRIGDVKNEDLIHPETIRGILEQNRQIEIKSFFVTSSMEQLYEPLSKLEGRIYFRKIQLPAAHDEVSILAKFLQKFTHSLVTRRFWH